MNTRFHNKFFKQAHLEFGGKFPGEYSAKRIVEWKQMRSQLTIALVIEKSESDSPKDKLSDEKAIPRPEVAQQSNQRVDSMGIVFFSNRLSERRRVSSPEVAQQSN
ncbi:MAG: hypothetical protein AB8B99_22715 [Phormidesmis sp.]